MESKNSKQYNKNCIPKPCKRKKYNQKLSKRKLSFSRNEQYLLNKYSNSQKSTNRTDLMQKISNINNYNQTTYSSSKIINIDFPKRKLNRARTFLKKHEKISNSKRKKVKNLELLIKLVDENEKIESEYYRNSKKLKNYKNIIKFERNKSDIGLYIPSITYNKNNIYFNKKYDLIRNKFNNTNTNNNEKNFVNLEIKHYKKESSKSEPSKFMKYKNLNIPDRKKKKSNTMNLNINSLNQNIITNYYNRRRTSGEINKTSIPRHSFNKESNMHIKSFLKNKDNKNMKDKYSFSVKSLSIFSKSKGKIKNNNIFPLANKIIEESSKIDRNLKYKYKNSNEEEKEKAKKKQLVELNNLTKKRKINIDLLRKSLHLDKNYFNGNKKNNCFDIYDILNKNTNKIKKIIPKNAVEIITEAANKIVYEDKMLHKDIIYYNNRLLGQFKENKKDKKFNKIFEKQKQIKKEIIGKPNNPKEQFIQLIIKLYIIIRKIIYI